MSSFLFTLYGDFVHREPATGEELPLTALVRLTAPFGYGEPAIRQAVSRLSRQGWLRGQRRGQRSFYALTERGRERIESINPRIYGALDEWDGRWRMLSYSVAEGNRAARDRLRKDLTVLGWAPLSQAIWLSPNGSMDAVRSAARACSALGDIELFSGSYCGPRSDAELLAKCWDLPAIALRYRQFLEEYGDKTAARASTDERAFTARMQLVHDFRKFAYLDPGFPSALLPAHWPGTSAAALFRRSYAMLEPPSNRFFAQTLIAP